MKHRAPATPEAIGADLGLLTFAGLGHLAAAELGCGVAFGGARIRLPNHDLVPCRLPPEAYGRLAGLRLVEDVFLLLGPARRLSSPHELARLNPALTAPVILAGLQLRNRCFRSTKPHRPSYQCFVKADTDGPVRRHAIAAHVQARLALAFPKWRPADPATVEIWAFQTGADLRLGLRLSDHRLRYRGSAPALREGALRPTIAAAMIQVADPQPGETVVDPMCGTGTLLAEGWARQPAATYRGGDLDPAAVELAGARLRHTPLAVQTWDARDLPLPAASVDCAVCNLPFGKQFATPEALPALYGAALEHWLTKLRPGGRLVLLSAAAGALEAALARLPVRWQVVTRVKVLGVWATLFRVTRRPVACN